MKKTTYEISDKESSLTALLARAKLIRQKERVGFLLPKILIRELNRMAGKRKKSQFVSHAIAKAIDEKQKQLEKHQLAQAYRGFAKQGAKIAEKWHQLDPNDWNNL